MSKDFLFAFLQQRSHDRYMPRDSRFFYIPQTFPGVEASLNAVHEFITEVVPENDAIALGSIALALADNAIKHTDSGLPPDTHFRGGEFTVELAAFPDRYQLRVNDQGSDSIPHLLEPSPDSNEHGLDLVARLAMSWQILGDKNGRAVIATVERQKQTRQRQIYTRTEIDQIT